MPGKPAKIDWHQKCLNAHSNLTILARSHEPVSGSISDIASGNAKDTNLPGGTMIRSRLQFRLLPLALVAAFAFLVSPNAWASVSETLTAQDIGQSFSIDWSYGVNGDTVASTGIFTLKSINASGLVLDATIDNTTKLTSSLTQSALMSMGISTSTPVTPSLSTAGTVFDNVNTPKNEIFPGGFKNIDTCVYAANGCSGGKIQYGLKAGSSDSFVLDLVSTTSLGSSPSLTLSQFAVKFQTNEGSFEFGGMDGGSIPGTPEPGTLFLFGTALLGVLFARTRNLFGISAR